MYRIISRKLQVLIRLAIIVSLAGYALSNPVAATHLDTSADHQAGSSQLIVQLDVQMPSDDSHPDFSADTGDTHLVKQDCSYDFCAGFVLVTFQDDTRGPVVSAIREFVDEHGVIDELHGLHRPPSI